MLPPLRCLELERGEPPIGPHVDLGAARAGRGFSGSTGRPQRFDLRPTDSVVPAL